VFKPSAGERSDPPERLHPESRLCLIGSGATILLGQPARGTEALDVWARASRFREEALRRPVRSAGDGGNSSRQTWLSNLAFSCLSYEQTVRECL